LTVCAAKAAFRNISELLSKSEFRRRSI
jgi:hypothetical protein